MRNFLQHPVSEHSRDLQQICQPLQKLDITYFSHVRINNKNEFAAICNNPDFMAHYVKKKYYNADIHMASSDIFSHFVIWDTIERCGKSKKMGIEALEFGIDHTFTIIESNKRGNDYYHFSTHIADKSFNQVYLRNFDLLQLFIRYFKDKIGETKQLAKAYDITYTIDEHAVGYETKNAEVISQQRLKRKGFLECIGMIDIRLSSRENQCLYLTIRGKTAKQIAKILGISNRTVEEYLMNVKNKMGVASKAEVIEKIITTPMLIDFSSEHIRS